MNLLEDKATSLRNDIATESKTRFESIDQIKIDNSFGYDYTELDDTDHLISNKIEQVSQDISSGKSHLPFTYTIKNKRLASLSIMLIYI